MFLTKTEEKILNGECGEAAQLAIKLLIAIGEVSGATRLIEIKSAHISGVSLRSIGKEGLEFLEDLVKMGAKVRVHTTINPCGIDLDRAHEQGIDREYIDLQRQIVKAYSSLGAIPSCGCAPYLFENAIKAGDHLAWAESSAVVYANSFIGAYTNKESGISALAAAIIGRTAYYGLHIDENRRPGIIIDVNWDVKTLMDYSMVGYIIGEIAGSKIPLIKGISPRNVSEKKQFSGGFSASSASGMVIFDKHYDKSLERIILNERDIKKALEKYSFKGSLEAIYLGCPHVSLEELREIAKMVKGKKLIKDIDAWIAISRELFRLAKEEGLIEIIEGAGLKVRPGSCIAVSPKFYDGVIGTNSFKIAYYLRAMKNLKVRVMPMKVLLSEVLEK